MNPEIIELRREEDARAVKKGQAVRVHYRSLRENKLESAGGLFVEIDLNKTPKISVAVRSEANERLYIIAHYFKVDNELKEAGWRCIPRGEAKRLGLRLGDVYMGGLG